MSEARKAKFLTASASLSPVQGLAEALEARGCVFKKRARPRVGARLLVDKFTCQGSSYLHNCLPSYIVEVFVLPARRKKWGQVLSMLHVIYATRCALFWDATRPLLSNVIE